MSETILVVEDQDDINQLITLNLRMLNFEVVSSDNGVDGLQKAIDKAFDLIVLDVMLPGMDGLQVCQALRAKHIYTPILMLTARKSEADRVVGLEIGADDYLTKPFSVLELQARVKALLRRSGFNREVATGQAEDSGELVVGDLRIQQQKRLVNVGDKTVNLTAKEFDLLLYLADSPGKVFSREKLLDAVWGYQHSGYEHTVNSHINRLRAKLEIDPAAPKYVMTVWGVGYKFSDI
ncbi:MAG: DNA-binding response regulator [Alteromonadaceae bacterium]|nr:MAG: DNA-binding response regulator [Alteromonadaceae bacterium]